MNEILYNERIMNAVEKLINEKNRFNGITSGILVSELRTCAPVPLAHLKISMNCVKRTLTVN